MARFITATLLTFALAFAAAPFASAATASTAQSGSDKQCPAPDQTHEYAGPSKPASREVELGVNSATGQMETATIYNLSKQKCSQACPNGVGGTVSGYCAAQGKCQATATCSGQTPSAGSGGATPASGTGSQTTPGSNSTPTVTPATPVTPPTTPSGSASANSSGKSSDNSYSPPLPQSSSQSSNPYGALESVGQSNAPSFPPPGDMNNYSQTAAGQNYTSQVNGSGDSALQSAQISTLGAGGSSQEPLIEQASENPQVLGQTDTFQSSSNGAGTQSSSWLGSAWSSVTGAADSAWNTVSDGASSIWNSDYVQESLGQLGNFGEMKTAVTGMTEYAFIGAPSLGNPGALPVFETGLTGLAGNAAENAGTSDLLGGLTGGSAAETGSGASDLIAQIPQDTEVTNVLPDGRIEPSVSSPGDTSPDWSQLNLSASDALGTPNGSTPEWAQFNIGAGDVGAITGGGEPSMDGPFTLKENQFGTPNEAPAAQDSGAVAQQASEPAAYDLNISASGPTGASDGNVPSWAQFNTSASDLNAVPTGGANFSAGDNPFLLPGDQFTPSAGFNAQTDGALALNPEPIPSVEEPAPVSQPSPVQEPAPALSGSGISDTSVSPENFTPPQEPITMPGGAPSPLSPGDSNLPEIAANDNTPYTAPESPAPETPTNETPTTAQPEPSSPAPETSPLLEAPASASGEAPPLNPGNDTALAADVGANPTDAANVPASNGETRGLAPASNESGAAPLPNAEVAPESPAAPPAPASNVVSALPQPTMNSDLLGPDGALPTWGEGGANASDIPAVSTGGETPSVTENLPALPESDIPDTPVSPESYTPPEEPLAMPDGESAPLLPGNSEVPEIAANDNVPPLELKAAPLPATETAGTEIVPINQAGATNASGEPWFTFRTNGVSSGGTSNASSLLRVAGIAAGSTAVFAISEPTASVPDQEIPNKINATSGAGYQQPSTAGTEPDATVLPPPPDKASQVGSKQASAPAAQPAPHPAPAPQPAPTLQTTAHSGGGSFLSGAMSAAGRFLSGLARGIMGQSQQQQPQPAPAQTVTPTVSIFANPQSVDRGATSTIIWSSVGTLSCQVTSLGGTTIGTGANGTHLASALATTTVFTAKCQTQSGGTISSSVTVSVN